MVAVTDNSNNSAMPLAPPGAGLPPGELRLARWVLFPVFCRLTRPEKAIADVPRHGHLALNRLHSVSPELAQRPVLVARLRGMEDSSRNWSLAMAVEHLRITGEGMAHLIETLAKGDNALPTVRIEDVKPSADRDIVTIATSYQQFLDTYPERMRRLGDLRQVEARHKHPWFGPMSAHQWLCLNAAHHTIHLSQMRLILKGLATV